MMINKYSFKVLTWGGSTFLSSWRGLQMHTEVHLGITSKLVSMSSLYNCISFLTKSRFLLDQLPYSSDLASDDFWLCSRIRFTLKVERVALLKPCKKCDLDSQELKKFQIYFCIEKKWGWKEVNNALILAGKWFSPYRCPERVSGSLRSSQTTFWKSQAQKTVQWRQHWELEAKVLQSFGLVFEKLYSETDRSMNC